ncbi:uncharacterized protein LOC114745119 [Neltuma alba]|uniref:uncharacterized protein LOC114745119 n=1 Tax=Neltuma alba TaxID=207710 RepID=UPI0010A2BCC8|nr:uncharacterized protein LOC114745119 [Prosopis alba]
MERSWESNGLVWSSAQNGLLSNPAVNLRIPLPCRFHPSFFVCRRHNDQKRYYELGPNDPPYAAKFYDCCGAEDPEASGCTANFHVSYDDD